MKIVPVRKNMGYIDTHNLWLEKLLTKHRLFNIYTKIYKYVGRYLF